MPENLRNLLQRLSDLCGQMVPAMINCFLGVGCRFSCRDSASVQNEKKMAKYCRIIMESWGISCRDCLYPWSFYMLVYFLPQILPHDGGSLDDLNTIAASIHFSATQLYCRLQKRCLCGRSVSVEVIPGVAIFLAFAEEVSVRVICVIAVILAFAQEICDLCRRSFVGVCREGVCVIDLVAPQFYWRLRRRCLCDGCVLSSEFFWRLRRS